MSDKNYLSIVLINEVSILLIAINFEALKSFN